LVEEAILRGLVPPEPVTCNLVAGVVVPIPTRSVEVAFIINPLPIVHAALAILGAQFDPVEVPIPLAIVKHPFDTPGRYSIFPIVRFVEEELVKVDAVDEVAVK
jgi:hypothetical protein